MIFLLFFFLLSSSCFAFDCTIPQPPNCDTPSHGCNTNQSQSSQNAVIGGSPSSSINFNGGNNLNGDWAPIPGQLAWPSLAFNGSAPRQSPMYMPPQVILQYKNNFSLEDAKRMSTGMRIKE